MHVGEILVTAAIGFVLIGAAWYLLTIYNGLVSLRNNISRSWSNIDVLLKQRHDELPKLVQTCQGYMQHERAVFDNLSAARGAILSAKTVGQRAEAEGQVS
jgi:LemA protein